ncbi:MAG: serine hydrolase [Oscillospiraceae bacterium]|nr:serine hydrolase [Oscillospiraceae bacterium]
MKKSKPDIFLGITMCMLVLAVVLCIVILFVQKNNSEKETTEPSQITTTESPVPSGSNSHTTENTEPAPSTETPPVPVDLTTIDEAGLKAALDDSLRGLTSEWQVMVIDPALGTKVGSAVNCGVDNWMTANRMTQVFIMGTVFQQVQDGTLVLEDVIDDVKAMIIKNDLYAADRLTERVGGSDSSKGREAVKSFAVSNGVKLGFNRNLSGSSSQKNYVTAQQTAEILNLICSGKLVSAEASRQMLDILLTPPETELEIDPGLTGENLRYGFVTDIESNTCICAMGVVELPNRSFVISIVCNRPVTTEGAKKKLTELISLVQPYFAE